MSRFYTIFWHHTFCHAWVVIHCSISSWPWLCRGCMHLWWLGELIKRVSESLFWEMLDDIKELFQKLFPFHAPPPFTPSLNPLKTIWFCYNTHFPLIPAQVYSGLAFNGLRYARSTVFVSMCVSLHHVLCMCPNVTSDCERMKFLIKHYTMMYSEHIFWCGALFSLWFIMRNTLSKYP